MKILLLFGKDEYTTGCYFEDALARHKDHRVLSAGITKPGLASAVNNPNRISTPEEFAINELIGRLPERPEVLFAIQGVINMRVHGIELLDIPTIYYGIDTHTRVKENIFNEAEKYKQVYFTQLKAVNDFREERGRESGWMPCCAEPAIHKHFDFEPEYDFAFVGGVDLKEAHKKRRAALKKLQTKYKVWIGNAYGFFMSMIYSKSRVVFNYAVNDDVNMRVFEAMAIDKPLLANKLTPESGMDKLFKDGEHYLGFTDDNLMEQAEKILKDCYAFGTPKIISGYKDVIKNHTYEKRTEEILCQIPKAKI